MLSLAGSPAMYAAQFDPSSSARSIQGKAESRSLTLDCCQNGSAEGWAALTNLITALKNVFSTAGAHFVFVAGPDVLDEVLAASRRGSAIYDGVFAMQRYVPCVSTGAGRVVVRRVAEYGGEAVDVVADYLDYRGRGLPRVLLSGLNDLVGYTGRTPILTIGPEQATSVAFFAGLHRRLANLRPPEQGPYWVHDE